jgi:hypothetical protein
VWQFSGLAFPLLSSSGCSGHRGSRPSFLPAFGGGFPFCFWFCSVVFLLIFFELVWWLKIGEKFGDFGVHGQLGGRLLAGFWLKGSWGTDLARWEVLERSRVYKEALSSNNGRARARTRFSPWQAKLSSAFDTCHEPSSHKHYSPSLAHLQAYIYLLVSLRWTVGKWKLKL